MLYQSVRPKRLKEVYGNKAIVASLQGAIDVKHASDRPHAYLFSGPSGCGKTTLGRILAEGFGCNMRFGLHELNAANTRGIDTVRQVTMEANIAPLEGQCKFYIFDEAHQLTDQAQNALLKVIEDCPEHCYFVFCTTLPDKIINTLVNRCAAFRVSSLRPPEMRRLLKDTIDGLELVEGHPILADTEVVIDAIEEAAAGCARQALMYLEQAMGMNNVEGLGDLIVEQQLGGKETIDLAREVVSGRSDRWDRVIDIYKRIDTPDAEQIRMVLLGYLKTCLLGAKDLEKADRYALMIRTFESNTYSSGQSGLIRMLFEACMV